MLLEGSLYVGPTVRRGGGVKVITARQARAARAVLGLSAQKLASVSGVSSSSIRRAEHAHDATVTLDLLARLQAFYEGMGFKFRWEPEEVGMHWPFPFSAADQLGDEK